jgi:SagB-type dehydrogenase family enzyme
MRQLDLDYLVIGVLLISGLYVATTGLMMDLFGSPQFFWHSYAGYASAALAGLHLALHWGRVTAYLGRRFRHWPGREGPVRQERTPLLGRRAFFISALAAAGGFVLGRVVAPPGEVASQSVKGDLARLYHQWSKPGYALTSLFSWGRQPARYKTYTGAERIALPDPHGYRGLSLEEAIEQRRSRREYTAEPLTLAELSSLLYAASGITAPAQGLRAAPSAGALYPIETYVVVHNVTELEPGLYHYAVAEHALEQLQTGDLRAKIVMAGLGQEMLGQAQVCFVLSAIFQRTRWKYRERAYRYILLETGHIAQNLYLAATSLGLGACAAGAFLDDQLNALLGLDGEEEAALYLIAVGRV